jgi:uncharacterized protein (TIGR02265 family)
MSQSNAVSPSVPGGDEMTDYDRRLPHAKPKDALRGLYVNAIFNAVRAVGGEQALREHQELLKDTVLKRRYIDFTNYPATDFLRIASAAVRVLAPHVGGQANAQRHIGKQGVNDFMNSMFGKTIVLLSGNSPQKALGSLPSGHSTSTNWGKWTVTMLSETSAHLSFQEELIPPYQNEGMLLAIMKASTAKNPQVQTFPKGILDCDFEVTWEK